MNWRNFFLLMAVAATCIIVISIVCPPASAYIYDLAQGDKAYQGDTVDLSLAAAWPEYKLAWCGGKDSCDSPLIIDTSDFNQHKVYLDPNRWKVGMYFRWDGKWNRGENQDAFEILPGTRPINATIVEYFNITTTTDQITQPAKSLPNSTHIILARGDDAQYQYAVPNSSTMQAGHIWLFGESKGGVGSQILGEPMEYRSNDSVYTFQFTQPLSESLTEGLYTGYIQFTGKNGLQDVFYRSTHKVGDDRVMVLDTPYDDEIIPDVPLNGFIPVRIQQEFETLAKPSRFCDDMLVPISMSVDYPQLRFTDYYEEGDNLTIKGKTTMSDGTIIIFKLDPAQYALKYDIMAHTWSTTATGLIDNPRDFSITIPVQWSEMAIGANHTVKAMVDKNRIHTEVFKDFKVTDLWIMPTPTPERERVLVEDYGWHRITPNATPKVTPTPALTPEAKPIPALQSNVTTNVTVSLVNTTTVPTTKPTPRPTPTVMIPVGPVTGILALAGIIAWRKQKCQSN